QPTGSATVGIQHFAIWHFRHLAFSVWHWTGGGWMAPKSDLLQGTLDLLILRTLSGGPMHGWGISQRIQQLSKDVLQVNQGSLYPALHRLEQQGLVEGGWGDSATQHQR